MSDDATRNLLSDRFDQLITLVKSVIANQSKTDARVERLERVLEERLYDTRPIWEAVQAELREIRERVGNFTAELAEMRVENSNAFRAVDRKIGVLGKTLIDMTADIRELQDKVEKIESQPS